MQKIFFLLKISLFVLLIINFSTISSATNKHNIINLVYFYPNKNQNKKSVFITWHLKKQYKNLPIKIYRKLSDSNKKRLITFVNLQRANSIPEILNRIGKNNIKELLQNNLYPISSKKLPKDKIKKQEIQSFANTILKQEKLTTILSYFIPEFAKIAANQFTDKYIQNNKKYIYYLVVIENEKEKIIAHSSITTDLPILVPTPKKIKLHNKSKSITVQFQPVAPNIGVIGYNIYRKGPQEKQYLRLNQYPVFFMESFTHNKKKRKKSQYQYTDKTLVKDGAYSYKIQAIHFSRAVSNFTLAKTIPYQKQEAIQPVEMQKAKHNHNNTITIQWKNPSKNKNVAYYNIYRSKIRSGNFDKINPIPIPFQKTIYIDSGINDLYSTFWYKIQSFTKNHTASNFSIAVPVNIIPYYITNPIIIQIYKKTTKEIGIRWKHRKKTNIQNYIIYRKELGENIFYIQKKIFQKNYYNDTKIRPGKQYLYQLRFEDRNGKISAPSNIAKASTQIIQKPIPPIHINVQYHNRKIRLYWKPIYTAGISGFHVYRKLTQQKKFMRISQQKISVKNNIYEDILPVGIYSAQYRLKAYTKTNLSSKFSAIIHANVPQEIPHSIQKIDLIKNTKTGNIHILWEKYIAYNIKGCAIYRKTKVLKTFQKIHEKYIECSIGQYIDRNTPKGTIYEYYIQVENNYNKKSIPSTIQKIAI